VSTPAATDPAQKQEWLQGMKMKELGFQNIPYSFFLGITPLPFIKEFHVIIVPFR
jgi:hypothetical protein